MAWILRFSFSIIVSIFCIWFRRILLLYENRMAERTRAHSSKLDYFLMTEIFHQQLMAPVWGLSGRAQWVSMSAQPIWTENAVHDEFVNRMANFNSISGYSNEQSAIDHLQSAVKYFFNILYKYAHHFSFVFVCDTAETLSLHNSEAPQLGNATVISNANIRNLQHIRVSDVFFHFHSSPANWHRNQLSRG